MAFTTIPAAGAKLRGSILNSLITEVRPISATKTSSTARTSDATRTADPHLTIALPASSSWEFELHLVLTSAANAAGDFTGELAYPADATVAYSAVGLVDTLASGSSADLNSRGAGLDTTTPTSNFDFGCSTTGTSVLVSGRIIVVTAGSLTLNWGQLASNANATTLFSGSSIVAHRVL